jgi:hypothetical protein
MKGVGLQKQNGAARASGMAMLLEYNHPRILQGQIPRVDTIVNVEGFEIGT